MTRLALLTVVLLSSVVRGEEVPSFRHEVVPLLTRLGCSTGACHGKQAGQNGFRLSLRGYAPEADHESVVREFQGRRVNRAVPADSLLVLKPLGETPHGGGRLFRRDSRDFETLHRWVAAGTPGLKDDEPAVTALHVLPGDRTLSVGEELPLSVEAEFADGSRRDVTWLSQFFSGDESLLSVDSAGRVKCLRPGAGVVRVHYEDLVGVVTLTVPYPHEVSAEDYRTHYNEVDRHVFAKLEALRLPPSELCDDATFFRRASLDVVGKLPTPDETRAFLADPAPDKRSRLVDGLLSRPEFADYWALQLADLLQNRKERDHDVRGPKGVRNFHAWLRRQVAEDRGWDAVATDVLTATGDSFAEPEVGYFVVTVGESRKAEESEVASSVAQSFLGTRIGCAKCHNHPLEKYTQDDYYHFAGFFARVGFDRQKPEEGPTVLKVQSEQEQHYHRRLDNTRKRISELEAKPERNEDEQRQLDGQRRELAQVEQELANFLTQPVKVRQPRTGAMLAPRPLDRSETATVDDPRRALAEWMTRPGNESFSGNMVNRLVKHFLGVGLVEPVDDLRPSNPPSNRELWDHLNEEFVRSGYSLKHVMRLVLNSRTYQLGSTTRPENAADGRFYSHFLARRLPAEVLLDALCDVTGVPEQFPGYPLGMRAVQIPDPAAKSYFLETFGRSERVTACACERRGEVTLPQLLHLQNGDWVGRKLDAGDGRLAEVLKSHTDDAAATGELFLLTLSRQPTEAERAAVTRCLAEADDRAAVFRDLAWALLNTKEFAFNH